MTNRAPFGPDRMLLLIIGPLVLLPCRIQAAQTPENELDYLRVVRIYADAMIAHGQDTYGEKQSPLFAEAIDRSKMQMLENDSFEKVAGISREEWGIRPHDRMIEGANPQHCQNLFQILYALTDVTGDSSYSEQANRSLKFFFENCQSSTTGLFWWGEHAGWDLHTDRPIDKPAGNTHEFYRPWVLWDDSWQLAPEACRRFAMGLWEHQIGNHQSGDYSRHATIDVRGAGTEAPYARHGGFYIETWATAYEKTQEDVFLRAIESVIDGLERARLHEGGMLVGGSKRKGTRRPYDVSLAVSLGDAAPKVPRHLATKMLKVADSNDRVFIASHTDAAGRLIGAVAGGGNLWANAYGASAAAAPANTYLLRYQQARHDAYRHVAIRTADAYRNGQADRNQPIWPGTMGSIILLMLNAHELTGNKLYLDAADSIGQESVKLFLSDGCPLPKASPLHNHYEAVTNGDTLMMALLKLWQVQNKPELELRLIFTDR